MPVMQESDNSASLAQQLAALIQQMIKQELGQGATPTAAPRPEVGAAPAEAPAPAPTPAPAPAPVSAPQPVAARFWPSYLDLPEVLPYSAKWKQNLATDTPNPAIFCLVSNLVNWDGIRTYVHNKGKLSENDNSISSAGVTALHNFSRFFLAQLYEEGVSPEQAQELLTVVGNAINGRLKAESASYVIDIPQVQIMFSSKNMEPVADGERTGFVDELHSWAISNASGSFYQKKALVKLS